MQNPSPAPRPVIAVTMGDPAGVGPELCLRALAAPEVHARCRPLVFGDSGVLHRVAERCGLPPPAADAVVACTTLDVDALQPGRVQAACGRAACAYIEAAVSAVHAGHAAALATAPIHKEALHAAGCLHPGHTEILAERTGATRTCMMLAAEEIVVSLATIHISLAEVPRQLTQRAIIDAAELTAKALGRLGKPRPRLVVCGLNPHAGEGGLFGREELEIVAPAVAELRRRGLAVQGPLPADSAFIPAQRRQTDAYIAMYHDQGLIPFKMLAFDDGVNITLALPIVRTSVDHGTAFDIAWQGKASPASLLAAIRWAVRLAG